MSTGQSSDVQPGTFTDVLRCDGEQKTVRVVEGHLLVCKGCCCGNTERNIPPVPVDSFKKEWKARGMRLRVHLSISACLGPCAVANVVLLTFKGSTVWFHSINAEADVTEIYDYIEHLLAAGTFHIPEYPLAEKVFQRYLSDAVCSFNLEK
jgi:cobaltochelatase CobN